MRGSLGIFVVALVALAIVPLMIYAPRRGDSDTVPDTVDSVTQDQAEETGAESTVEPEEGPVPPIERTRLRTLARIEGLAKGMSFDEVNRALDVEGHKTMTIQNRVTATWTLPGGLTIEADFLADKLTKWKTKDSGV